LAELAVLTGLRLQRLPAHLGSRQAILERYGLSPQAQSTPAGRERGKPT
jgi:hypothetical protein